MKQTLLLFLLFVSTGSFAQAVHRNYLKSRDELYNPACGWRDSLTAAEVTASMRKVDTSRIRRNIDLYYTDLAMVEYQLYAHTMDTAILRSAANHSVIAVRHNPKSGSGLWSAASNFQRLGECDRTNYYLDLYEQRVKEKYRISREQIAILRAKCAQ